MHITEINIRDPFVLFHDGKYYLYGTRSDTCWGEAFGFDCYAGENLEEFEGPFEIFKRHEGFFATENYWAPECYFYNGRFYLLTTFGGKEIKKGLYLLVYDNPTGPFEMYSERLTPSDLTCIDGTLWFEEDNIYLVYSHSFEDGEPASICFQKMSPDLTTCITEPEVMFPASDAPWAKPVPFAKEEFGMDGDVYFTDGPFLFRGEDGNLFMTWSSWSRGSYAVGVAVSTTGNIKGPWRQQEEPIWKENGGHGMVFEDISKKRYFCLHNPNDKSKERPVFRELLENNGELLLLEP